MDLTTNTAPQYGQFSDNFMYKFLSDLLASITLPTPTSDDSISDSNVDFINYKLDYDSDSTLKPASSSDVTTVNTMNIWDTQNFTYDFVSTNFSNSSLDSASFWSPVAIIIAGTLLSIVTAGGNLMVMVAFKLERQLQTISNYFLFSLAMADLTIGLISIPLMTFYTARDGWELGYTTCQFWLSTDYLMSNASVMNLLLISFDRYFSVTRPLTYRPRRTSKKAMIMIASTFLISLLLWPPLIIAWPHIEGEFRIASNECIVQFLKTNPAVTVGMTIAAFYGPVIIMIVLYGRVYYVTRTRQRELVKLQAFHQKSIRRTISSNADSRIPLRNTLSTASSTAAGKQTPPSKAPATATPSLGTVVSAMDTDIDLAVLYCTAICNENTRTPLSAKRSVIRTTLKRIETDAKPWGFHNLLNHFNRPKPILSIPSTRHASVISSGFEDDETASADGDTTTYGVSEEALPLKHRLQRQFMRNVASPSPSDYGSTVANQFINHVRQSFLISRPKNPFGMPKNEKRSLSVSNSRETDSRLVHMASMLTKRHFESRDRKQKQKHLEVITNNNSSYDPANSPIKEIRKTSASKINAKCVGVTQSVPTQSTSKILEPTHEENEADQEHDVDESPTITPKRSHSTGGQPNSVYTVLIQLGKSSVENPPPAPPPPHLSRNFIDRKISNRPIITLYKNSTVDQTHLSPDRGYSFSTADVSFSSAQSMILRRLSSCSTGAISDSPSASPARVVDPLLAGNRSISQCGGAPSPLAGTPVSNSKLPAINRLASPRRISSYDSIQRSHSALIANSHAAAPVEHRSHRKKRERRQQESKAARTLSAILLAFVITWAPYSFIVCIESFHPHSVPAFWFTFSYYLCYLNSAVNPFLYALCNATFRRTFWHIMTFKWATFKRRHSPQRPHHQAAVALTAVAIAAGSGSRAQPFSATTSLR